MSMDMPSLPLPRAAEGAGARVACFIHVLQANHSFGSFVFPAVEIFLPAEMMEILRRWAALVIFPCLVAIAQGQ